MDISGVVKALNGQVEQAIDYKNAEKNESDPNAVKIPEFHRIIGANGRTLANGLSDQSFKDFGLSQRDIDRVRSVGMLLRDAFVEKYGDVSTSTGFDSKPGTKYVGILKSFLELPDDVSELTPEDRTSATDAIAAWYENAPLRGRAAGVKNQGKDDAENVKVDA